MDWSDIPSMTFEQAQFVRKLRVRDEDTMHTWREIALICNYEWGGNWGSNQIAGMEICQSAASFFGENYINSPWN